MISHKPNRLLTSIILTFALIAIVIHYAVFDGIHKGEVRGIVKEVYVKGYAGWKAGSSFRHKAKLELENGQTVSVFCENHCKPNTRITVQVYEPIFSTKTIYVYKTVYPF